jgi:zinc transporter ZupT
MYFSASRPKILTASFGPMPPRANVVLSVAAGAFVVVVVVSIVSSAAPDNDDDDDDDRSGEGRRLRLG